MKKLRKCQYWAKHTFLLKKALKPITSHYQPCFYRNRNFSASSSCVYQLISFNVRIASLRKEPTCLNHLCIVNGLCYLCIVSRHSGSEEWKIATRLSSLISFVRLSTKMPSKYTQVECISTPLRDSDVANGFGAIYNRINSWKWRQWLKQGSNRKRNCKSIRNFRELYSNLTNQQLWEEEFYVHRSKAERAPSR